MEVFYGISINSICRGLTSAHALAVIEFERVALLDPLVMTAVGTETGQGKVHLSVKLQFLGNNFKNLSTLRKFSLSEPGSNGPV